VVVAVVEVLVVVVVEIVEVVEAVVVVDVVVVVVVVMMVVVAELISKRFSRQDMFHDFTARQKGMFMCCGLLHCVCV
jgi:hypothetical protein